MASPISIENPALAKDSIVAVTGANGYIASQIVDLFLAAGYRVRGTVRDRARSAWLQTHFDSAYGQGRFSLVEVPDVSVDGAFDSAFDGAHGVVHTLAITILDPNPDNVVPPNVAVTLNVARGAAKASSVTRFAYTSSSGAAAIPKPGVEYVVNKDTYNEEAVAIAYSGKGPKGPAGGYLSYSAAKTKAEQALWKWYKEEKPSFVLNSIVPNAALGRVLQPQHQGFPTAVGLLKPVWDGHLAPELVYMFPAQWYTDVIDIARMHVAALLFSDVKDERLISYGGRFNINDILAVFRKVHPDKTFPEDLPNLQVDIGKVDSERATGLLKRLGQSGWVSLEDCLRPLAEQYAKA